MCKNAAISILITFVLFVVLIQKHTVEGQDLNKTDGNTQRDSKFALFSVVRFENSGCLAINGFNGTCYKQADCTSLNGAALGTCALGFGVCCYFQRGCGTTSSLNNTYFVGPDTLGKAIGSCQYSITRSSADVCQIRLDFENFRIAAPNPDGDCVDDKLTITGASVPVPAICGVNAGQHLYLSTGSVQTPIMLTVSGTKVNENRDWRIKSTQIPCDVMSIAPEGCLQYFTGVTGMIQSFNWLPESNGRHLNNQQYSICIRTEQGFCSICYSQCKADTSSFSIFHGAPPFMSLINAACPNDYLMIPCAQATTAPLAMCNTNLLCGGVLNVAAAQAAPSKVCSTVRPFRVLFKTNENEMDDSSTRGFCLTYNQSPC